MHKGRSYPFHPTFWATEAWYWPGYMPYTLYGVLNSLAFPPWNAIVPHHAFVSDPGVPSMDAKVMAYHFTLHPPHFATSLDVSLDRIVISGVKYARWRASIGDGVHIWSTAFLLQTFPQTLVQSDPFSYAVPAPPYTSSAGPDLDFHGPPWGWGPDPPHF